MMKRNRRPYLTLRVADGLESIARRIVPQDADEEMALTWIHRIHRWRLLSSLLLDPQEAEACLPSGGADADHVRSPKETNP